MQDTKKFANLSLRDIDALSNHIVQQLSTLVSDSEAPPKRQMEFDFALEPKTEPERITEPPAQRTDRLDELLSPVAKEPMVDIFSGASQPQINTRAQSNPAPTLPDLPTPPKAQPMEAVPLRDLRPKADDTDRQVNEVQQFLNEILSSHQFQNPPTSAPAPQKQRPINPHAAPTPQPQSEPNRAFPQAAVPAQETYMGNAPAQAPQAKPPKKKKFLGFINRKKV